MTLTCDDYLFSSRGDSLIPSFVTEVLIIIISALSGQARPRDDFDAGADNETFLAPMTIETDILLLCWRHFF